MSFFTLSVEAKTVEEIVSGVKQRSQKEALEFLRDYINAVFSQDILTIMAEGKVLQAAMVQNSENAEIAYAMGYYLSRANKMQEAVAILEKVRAKNPRMLYVQRTLAYCYKHLKENRKAVELYEEVIAKESDQYGPAYVSETYLSLGVLYQNLGEYEKSLAALRKSQELNPRDADIYLTMANTYYELQKWDKVVEYANKSLEIEDHPFTRRTKGLALENKEMYKEAREQYRQAVLLDPSFVDGWISLGHCYLNLLDDVRAEETYRHVLMLDPQNEYAYSGLGVMYYRQGKYSESVQAYSQALQINSKNTFVLEKIKEAKAQLVKKDMLRTEVVTRIKQNSKGRKLTPMEMRALAVSQK